VALVGAGFEWIWVGVKTRFACNEIPGKGADNLAGVGWDQADTGYVAVIFNKASEGAIDAVIAVVGFFRMNSHRGAVGREGNVRQVEAVSAAVCA